MIKQNFESILTSSVAHSNVLVFKNILARRRQSYIFFKLLFLLKQSSPAGSDPLWLLTETLEYLRPLIVFRFKKVAGTRHRLPFLKTEGATRDQFQAVLWLLESASKRPGFDFSIKLRDEILDISKRRGFAVKARSVYHKTALLQRPFLKFL